MRLIEAPPAPVALRRPVAHHRRVAVAQAAAAGGLAGWSRVSARGGGRWAPPLAAGASLALLGAVARRVHRRHTGAADVALDPRGVTLAGWFVDRRVEWASVRGMAICPAWNRGPFATPARVVLGLSRFRSTSIAADFEGVAPEPATDLLVSMWSGTGVPTAQKMCG